MQIRTTVLATLLATTPFTARAVSDAEFDELRSRFDSLAAAVESGAGSAAHSATQIGGYGELHYNNYGSGGKEIDFHRFVLFVNHEFTDNIRFFSEVEIEHAFHEKTECEVDDANTDGIVNVGELECEETPGEFELEQAYIQFDLDDSSTANVGLFLLPIGILNETHEPDTFYGVERNPVENAIIPSTWWEAGAMYSTHNTSGVSFDVAITSGLKVDAGSVSIRGGRQKVAEAKADNLAVTGRIRYTGTAGLELAASVQVQDDITQDSTDNVEGATLLETHVVYQSGAFGARALYAMWNVDGTGASAIGADEQTGAYVEASSRLTEGFGVFARHSLWDTTAGSAADTQRAQSNVGFNYWPHPHVVLKFDDQSQDANAGDNDGINLGMGYQF
jgi:hypothetical protein